ncbi:MAG: D-alanine--D-alanine ligase [Bacteroidetes bacterium]|nr:MAG: D-alanine--D-alanine ligase [Bacteroidota bacterium]
MKNIAVVCGGFSGEEVISMRSADFVLQNMDTSIYKPFKVIISIDRWYCEIDGKQFDIDKNDFSFKDSKAKVNFDGVYIIIHGRPGENGQLQAYFQMLNIPYTSSDFTVSAIASNKAYCNYMMKSLNVNTMPSVHLIAGGDIEIDSILEQVGLPCFVKPNSGGSSIGMSKVKAKEELAYAIEKAFAEDEEVLIESFFEGREVTCGLLQKDNEMIVFPICEVHSKTEFFDFEAKYTSSLVEEIIPAQIPEEIANVIKSTSVFIYKKLNFKGVIRIDYIFNDDNDYIFIEANTIPGMTQESIVPQMAREFGWSNTGLVSAVLDEIF